MSRREAHHVKHVRTRAALPASQNFSRSIAIVALLCLLHVAAKPATSAGGAEEGEVCGGSGGRSMLELIQKKRDGGELTSQDIWEMISGFHEGRIPDYQMAAMLMAIYMRGMSDQETFELTASLVRTGTVADLSSLGVASVDKHSTGGVGDKVSLALAPLVASFGLAVPMMSGRGLGHTGGTLDKLESLPGVTTTLTSAQFMEQLKEIQVVISGPTESIAPVDKTLYALRDVTGTASSLPLIVSSIMSKKLAEGPDALLLDVKTGDGAFLPDLDSAHKLAEAMLAAGERASKKVVAMMTDMSQPLGRAVGNWLELREAVEVLSGKGPSDVVELVLAQCALMLVMAGKAPSYLAGRRMAKQHLEGGKGLDQLRLLVRAQGATAEAEALLDNPDRYPPSQHSIPVVSTLHGWVSAIGAREIGLVNKLLGGGREDKSSQIDLKAGIVLHRKVGEAVTAGNVLATLYSDKPEALAAAAARVSQAFAITAEPVTSPPLISHVFINGSSLPWPDYIAQQAQQEL